MKMQQTCDLELRLFPTSYDSDSSDTSVIESSSTGNQQPKEESQRITIFYNGKSVSSDVTHLQEKSIIYINGEQRNGKEVILKRVGFFKQVDPISSPSASKSKGINEKISSKFSSETENSNSSYFTLLSSAFTRIVSILFV